MDAGYRAAHGKWSHPDRRLLRAARPILLTFADRADLADAAKDWTARVDVITAASAEPPADAVLIRPDGYVAWAADSGTPSPADDLRAALQTWFGDAA
jgi:Aromatic-ring hydroxylase, C-terminal